MVPLAMKSSFDQVSASQHFTSAPTIATWLSCANLAQTFMDPAFTGTNKMHNNGTKCRRVLGAQAAICLVDMVIRVIEVMRYGLK